MGVRASLGRWLGCPGLIRDQPCRDLPPLPDPGSGGRPFGARALAGWAEQPLGNSKPMKVGMSLSSQREKYLVQSGKSPKYNLFL